MLAGFLDKMEGLLAVEPVKVQTDPQAGRPCSSKVGTQVVAEAYAEVLQVRLDVELVMVLSVPWGLPFEMRRMQQVLLVLIGSQVFCYPALLVP